MPFMRSHLSQFCYSRLKNSPRQASPFDLISGVIVSITTASGSYPLLPCPHIIPKSAADAPRIESFRRIHCPPSAFALSASLRGLADEAREVAPDSAPAPALRLYRRRWKGRGKLRWLGFSLTLHCSALFNHNQVTPFIVYIAAFGRFMRRSRIPKRWTMPKKTSLAKASLRI